VSELDRIRWHCRRGLLELDLVLRSFVDGRYAALGDADRRAFGKLLEYADNDLLDLVMGRAELVEDKECATVLALLRQRGASHVANSL
jgi:succinate dehydrogenase flavin-adding protein (antitoxin of CptAB toxin-antitoxin module)